MELYKGILDRRRGGGVVHALALKEFLWVFLVNLF